MGTRIIWLTFLGLIVTSACTGHIDKRASFTVTIARENQNDLNDLYKISSEHPPEFMLDGVTCVSWSPDAKRIAYSSMGNIFIKDISLKEEESFEVNFWHLTQPVWSPDGMMLAFEGLREPELAEDIWLMDVNTGKLERINICEEDKKTCFISAPDWSIHNSVTFGVRRHGYQSIVEYDPLAGRIVTAYPLEALNLITGSYFGNDSSVINIDSVTSVAWSPDNIHLAIVTNDVRSNVYVLNTHTMNVVDVTRSRDLSVGFDSPIWSSDGQYLLLRKLKLRQYDFWEVVEYDIIWSEVTTGLSDGGFQFNTLYESDAPLICPGNLVVTE